jgi:CTP synthase (UTP-ammonia lyase)
MVTIQARDWLCEKRNCYRFQMKIMALGDRDPAHLTHREIDAVLDVLNRRVECSWVFTDSAEAHQLDKVDGVWLLPGTPYRDALAAFEAIDHCLDTGKPFLGTCGGFQHAVLALVRSRAGITYAAHGESDPEAEFQAIVPLECSLYGETRTVYPINGTTLASICGSEPFDGFHWCGFGVAEGISDVLIQSGVVISAIGDDVGVEAIEMPDHPFFLATAFQPQVGTGISGLVHPLIESFVNAVAISSCKSR